MSFSTFRGQLYTLINNNKDALGVQEVYSTPRLNFKGYPAVTISPSDNENDYETNTENIRSYVFNIRCFYDTKNSGIDDGIDNLEETIDSLIDLIDQENEKKTGNIIGQGMPSRYTYLNIFAVPSGWFLTEDEAMIFNQMTVRIRVSVDVV